MKSRLKQAKIYELIEYVIESCGLRRMVKYLCDLADVSRSGYYHYLSAKELRDKKHQKYLEDYKVIKKAYAYKNCDKESQGIVMALKNVF